jgi:hypothetical protein
MFAFLAVMLVGGAAAQRALRPSDFGDLGSYRAGAVYEVAGRTPIHEGEATCGTCHEEILATHAKDIHVHVECEVCHGSGDRHVRHWLEEESSIGQREATMPKEYTLEGCLFCHRKLEARPRTFPQVDPSEHYRFLHVNELKTKCIECHSPHEPLFLLTHVDQARKHPMIYECGDCHDEDPKRDHVEVEDHPTIFVCRDCHPEVTEDFEQRQHSFLGCTSCHLFHEESESAGRIFNNGNRRFCLLCHERKKFKDEEKLPQIVSAEHLGDMADQLNEAPGALAEDPRACLYCHYENVHDRELIERARAAHDD